MTLEQREALLDAITEYGRAERAFGRDVLADNARQVVGQKSDAVIHLVFDIYTTNKP